MEDPQRIEREEVEAALEVRRELGPAYEPAVVDSLADKVERAVEARVDARLAARKSELKHEEERSGRSLALGITSLALGIPISAVASGTSDNGLPGLLVAWAGIVGVNWAYAWQNRATRRG